MLKPKTFYITTSIAYANAAPHIGFAMEVCQADVLARYHRMKGDDVFLLSGTDENGSKNKKTAEEKKMEPQKFVDENSAKFQLLLDTLDISNNDFIRTTDKKRHWPAAQKIWDKLAESGDIYKDSYEGCYCVGCEAYLTEKDLVDGKCPNHQKAPEKIKEENYFFRLSNYSKIIQEKIELGELEILPESRKNEILNVIKSGLKDISFSRSKKVLDWGIPVPNDHSQTMYVWCDALTNYISALGYGESEVRSLEHRDHGLTKTDLCKLKPEFQNENFQKYWPADIHIIGKDILRFHAAIWPAMLLSANLPLPKKIFVHGFITSNGQKMSKSLGNVIDPFEIIDKYGVDALRYYLLKEIPSRSDGDFSYDRFEEIYQADLANGIGNLTARIIALSWNKDFCPKASNLQAKDLALKAKNTWLDYEKLLNNFRLNEALEITQKFMSACDEYIEINKPWQLEGKEKEKIIYNLSESLRHIAWMIYPFMPETSMKIFEQLFADKKERKIELNKNLKEAQEWDGLKLKTKIKKGEILFPRLPKN
ncbi:methionine--tRNA ligase [Candidatus Parcubacteria bacterium]|nr:methionine--tRNA ligase [Candidatus Parcubacteria bacterium]